MFVKIVFFSFLGIFSNLSSAQRTTCTFQHINNVYTCRLENQNIGSDNDMQEVGGVHRQNFGDMNVLRLDHTTSSIQIFPSLVIDRFVNLQRIHLSSVEMTTLDRYIVNCARLHTVELNMNEITTIPQGIFRNCQRMTSLSMNRNQISRIHDNAFVGLTSLSSLWLVHNNIQSINRNMMRPMTVLASLFLDDNEIEEIEAAAIEVSSNLRRLSLRNNKISSWSVEILQNNPLIRELILSGNQIQTLSADSFSNLQNLVELWIGSLLEEIPVLENMQRLETLVIENNNLKHVSAASFAHMENLIVLNLGRNQIETIDFSMTSPRILRNLRTLELTANNIESIEEGTLTMLKDLTRLGLSRNQLQRLSIDSIRPVLPLISLDVQRNQIRSLDREIFEQETDMHFFALGNVCVSEDLLINSTFDMNRLESCFNSAVDKKVNLLGFVFVILVSGLVKM